ncbi:OmpA family protein [Caulobacter sp.]|uniref:OmpA family protein n=1 Tax=Caulobacter sp. TaxID=78 RepID=UPI003BAE6B68
MQADPSCEDFSVQIYFENRSAKLTSEARSVLKSAEAMATGCKVASVRVIGLADSVGAPETSLAVSKQRADTVTRALAKMGHGNVMFEVGAAGEAGATTRDGEARPLRRRADIRFDLDGKLR